MENEDTDHFLRYPMLFVTSLSADNVERAIRALVDDERFFSHVWCVAVRQASLNHESRERMGRALALSLDISE